MLIEQSLQATPLEICKQFECLAGTEVFLFSILKVMKSW